MVKATFWSARAAFLCLVVGQATLVLAAGNLLLLQVYCYLVGSLDAATDFTATFVLMGKILLACLAGSGVLYGVLDRMVSRQPSLMGA